ncbi:VOC family protein [Neobacillus sp. FSL H8-0543]|uniref:VOC family protein n=1 Tax=Neobacillus sp. FSL H8-0543 TaxID=2954672 RepID=UPI00315842A3
MRFHHLAIEVNDLETSSAFYQDYLGLQEERRMIFDDEELIFLVRNDFRLELIFSGPQQQSTPQAVHLCFEVDRIGDIVNRFAKRGRAPLEGPYVLENGWKTVFYEGPDHEVLEFLQIEP